MNDEQKQWLAKVQELAMQAAQMNTVAAYEKAVDDIQKKDRQWQIR